MTVSCSDMRKVEDLFEGWEETLITSCLQQVMGEIFVTDPVSPSSAEARINVFSFYGGIPDRELLLAKPEGFRILVPGNKDWETLIEETSPECRKVTRYAIRKDTVFDREHLEGLAVPIPQGYELREIDREIFGLCRQDPGMADLVSSFETWEQYERLGLGVALMKDGDIAAGASSFTSYRDGIEIEVDTKSSERRKHLATVCCANLILRCLERGLYPSWDAQNRNSVGLAEKLGYTFSHEYIAYEVF